MVRDTEPLGRRNDEEPAFWRFPDIESRRWQQFNTLERTSKIRTLSRTCTICGQFMLVRYPDGKLDDLTPEQKRFAELNLTPCELALASFRPTAASVSSPIVDKS